MTFVFFDIFMPWDTAVTVKHLTPATCVYFIIFNSIVAYWWHAVQKQLSDIHLQLGPSKPHQSINNKKQDHDTTLSFSCLTSVRQNGSWFGETKLGPLGLFAPFYLFFFFIFNKNCYIEFIYYNTQQEQKKSIQKNSQYECWVMHGDVWHVYFLTEFAHFHKRCF